MRTVHSEVQRQVPQVRRITPRRPHVLCDPLSAQAHRALHPHTHQVVDVMVEYVIRNPHQVDDGLDHDLGDGVLDQLCDVPWHAPQRDVPCVARVSFGLLSPARCSGAPAYTNAGTDTSAEYSVSIAICAQAPQHVSTARDARHAAECLLLKHQQVVMLLRAQHRLGRARAV